MSRQSSVKTAVRSALLGLLLAPFLASSAPLEAQADDRRTVLVTKQGWALSSKNRSGPTSPKQTPMAP
jgi:hypothetical protein